MLQVQGSYAIAVLYEGEKDKLIAARKESPLILGLGDKEHFVASDIPAILPYTRKMIFLEDGEMAVVQDKGFQNQHALGVKIGRGPPKEILWDPVTAEKGGFKHFMLKEIFEQPRAIVDTVRGRVSLDEGRVFLKDSGLSAKALKEIRPGMHRGLRDLLPCSPGGEVHDRSSDPDSHRSGFGLGISLPGPHRGSS